MSTTYHSVPFIVFLIVILASIRKLWCSEPSPSFHNGQRICDYRCRRPFSNKNCSGDNPKETKWTYSTRSQSCKKVKGCYGNNNTYDIYQDCLDECHGCKTLLKKFNLNDICLKELQEFNKCDEGSSSFFVYNPSVGNCFPVQGCKGPGYYKTYNECNKTCPNLKL